MTQPLVSCVMMTRGRRHFVPLALRYFLRQDYENRELVILDDGPDPIEDLLPKDSRIAYHCLTERLILGEKVNVGCERSRGEVIAMWDNDVWYAANRLSRQVSYLLKAGGKLCGVQWPLFFDIAARRAWQWREPTGQRPWLCGSSLVFLKTYWSAIKHEVLVPAYDTAMNRATPESDVVAVPEKNLVVETTHAENSFSRGHETGVCWHTALLDDVAAVMGQDFANY